MTAKQQIRQWVNQQDTSYLLRLANLIAEGSTPARAVRIIRISDAETAKRQQKGARDAA